MSMKRDLGPKPKARKLDKPSIEAFGDHEIITVPNPLSFLVRRVADDNADDPIARAEKALENLSSQFDGWMLAEFEKLEQARAAITNDGMTPQTCDALFRAAHDIKGGAPTFGYPVAAAAADSLCRVIEHTPEIAKMPLELVDYHIDAIRAIIREHDRIDAANVAKALSQKLRGVADDYLVQVNRDRPEHLEAVNAPSIAPQG